MSRILWVLCLCTPLFAQSADLVAKFTPSFLIAQNDCAGVPAEFEAATAEPRVKAANGTIYAQKFERAGGAVEIHYYHLWSRDCGRMGHPLDAEHVSVLLRDGHAVYWFAAAHEDTICDNSHAISASSLNATEHGATVWISQDKHASFLKKELCERGCGRDRCEGAKPLALSKVIELDAAAPWVRSAQWPLAAKSASNFTEALLAQLEAAPGVVFTNPQRPGVKGVVRVSDTTASATGGSLATATHAVTRSLRKAHRAATGWIPN